jgi:VIT1/CCC1 family predicted Fe2+/Mn2+ transporter
MISAGLTTLVAHPRNPPLAEEKPAPDQATDRQRELDGRVEELTRQIAEVVNRAGVEQRQDLREYAIGLLKEETEVADALPASAGATHVAPFNPLAVALLLVLAAVPLLLSIVFAPVGIAILVIALGMGLWGLLTSLVRR